VRILVRSESVNVSIVPDEFKHPGIQYTRCCSSEHEDGAVFACRSASVVGRLMQNRLSVQRSDLKMTGPKTGIRVTFAYAVYLGDSKYLEAPPSFTNTASICKYSPALTNTCRNRRHS
jgi:hypothetical protein